MVDYGAYSSSGERHRLGGAGNVSDHGSLIEYWGARSAGFPAVALLRLPVLYDRCIGDVFAAEASGEVTVTADPATVEAAADEAVAIAVTKLATVMAAAR